VRVFPEETEERTKEDEEGGRGIESGRGGI